MQPLMTIPNMLTLSRICLIPIFVVIYYLPFSWAHGTAAILFVIGAFTDWLDGFLARNLQQNSQFGAFLDPVADKLAVVVALVLAVGEINSAYVTIPAAIIVGREIVISGLREWMAEIGKRTHVAVVKLAKLKTVLQMLALTLLLLYKVGQTWVGVTGIVCLYAAALLTIWSMIMYLRAAWQDLTLSSNK